MLNHLNWKQPDESAVSLMDSSIVCFEEEPAHATAIIVFRFSCVAQGLFLCFPAHYFTFLIAHEDFQTPVLESVSAAVTSRQSSVVEDSVKCSVCLLKYFGLLLLQAVSVPSASTRLHGGR